MRRHEAYATASGRGGHRVVTVPSGVGFQRGQIVFLHQTRGASAGAYEFATVDAVGSTTLTMTYALTITLSSDGDNRGQVVVVPRYTSVTFLPAGGVSAPPWDGQKGGIVVFKATGPVLIDGSLDASGAGFRGASHAAECAAGRVYNSKSISPPVAGGFFGESSTGASGLGPTISARGSGGSGGPPLDCGSGGGGGHGAPGKPGDRASGMQVGGAGGDIAGSADLGSAVLFGGAGGEGGPDEDGAYPGVGGNGGGIVWIDASSIEVTGRVAANGTAGGDGNQSGTCGGNGSGMGGGGGGSGGTVRLRVTDRAAIGSGLVVAQPGAGGRCAAQAAVFGGAGGEGRIGVTGPVGGSSIPALDNR